MMNIHSIIIPLRNVKLADANYSLVIAIFLEVIILYEIKVLKIMMYKHFDKNYYVPFHLRNLIFFESFNYINVIFLYNT